MLGIDVSKTTLACTLVNPQTRRAEWGVTVPNTSAGVAELVRRTPADCPWVLEPTGRYSGPVAAQAQAAGRRVLLAEPKRANAFLRAVQPRAKTDRVDSRGLALYALATALRPYPRKSPTVECVEQLLAARASLSQTLVRLRQQQADLPHAAEPLGAAIAALETQRRELDRRLAEQRTQTDELPGVAELEAVPGIGLVTATAVAACLRAKPFATADAFVAYCGLDTRVRDSGQQAGRRRLSKRGDAELRRLFYLSAAANVRRRDPENPFKQQYLRERAKGLPATAALCVVARKLARVCWAILRHRTAYDPALVH